MRNTQTIDSSTPAFPYTSPWRLDMGAEVQAEGVFFRVWAPKSQHVEVVIEDGDAHAFQLTAETGGYFSGLVPRLKAGALYWYRLDGDSQYPDPCARFQPYGPLFHYLVLKIAASCRR